MRGTFVAGVEGVPFSTQEHSNQALKSMGRAPLAHRCLPDSRCSSGPARSGTGRSDGQVHENPATPGPFAKDFQGGAIGTRLLIVETDMLVNKVADRLHQRPAGRK